MADHLHELIASLSMAERNYFKRFAAKLLDDGAANYVLLFDAVYAQEEYDEAALKQQFAGQKFAKHFGVTKNYLHNAVLRALKNYNEENSVQNEARHLLLQLDILMDKGLYEQAYKLIRKGVKLAQEHELFHEQNAFQSHELFLLMNNYQEGERSVEEVMEAQKSVSLLIANLTDYEALYQQQHQLNKRIYQLREEADKQAYEAYFQLPLAQKKELALSGRARHFFHFIRTLHYSVTDQRQAFLHEAKLLVDETLACQYFTAAARSALMNTLNLQMEAAYYNQAWPDMNDALQKLQALELRTERDRIAQFIYHSRFALIYHDQQKDDTAKLQLIDECWAFIKKHEQQIPFHIRVSIYVTYCSALLEMGEYKKAVDWIELYRQNKKESETRNDVQSLLLLMQLIAHYELGNVLLVKNLLPNIARFIRINAQQSEFEKTVLSFINKLASAKELNEELFANTLQELNALKDGDILHRNRTLHDIFRVFIESKQHGRKYHQQLQIALP